MRKSTLNEPDPINRRRDLSRTIQVPLYLVLGATYMRLCELPAEYEAMHNDSGT